MSDKTTFGCRLMNFKCLSITIITKALNSLTDTSITVYSTSFGIARSFHKLSERENREQ